MRDLRNVKDFYREDLYEYFKNSIDDGIDCWVTKEEFEKEFDKWLKN